MSSRRVNPLVRELVTWLAGRGREAGPLLIVTHDHPDPDSLASAWALAEVAAHLTGMRPRIRYGGAIGRRENQMMAELLGVPAAPLEPADLTSAGVSLALVDTQPPFDNNTVARTRRAALIVDHHPRHAETAAELALIDEHVGATTTILGEALLATKTPVSDALATAIVYGIGSETQNLAREAGPRDASVYHAFLPRADKAALWRIANPPQPASYFRVLARGLRDAFVYGEIVGVHLGPLDHPDAVAQLADVLLTHEGMRWSLVTGRYRGNLHLSLRAASARANAGAAMTRIVGDDHYGGGHRMLAGGRLPVGADAEEAGWRAVEDRVLAAFLKLRRVPAATPPRHPFRDEA